MELPRIRGKGMLVNDPLAQKGLFPEGLYVKSNEVPSIVSQMAFFSCFCQPLGRGGNRTTLRGVERKVFHDS